MAPSDRRDSMEDALREAVSTSGNDSARITPTRRYAMMAVLLCGLLFSVMDTTIVSTALITITTDLGDFQNVYWVVLSYVLAYIGFCLGIAKLADHFGRQIMVIASWTVFVAFSIGCGCSKTMTQLIIFRALQGVGGSGLYSLCQIIIAEIAAPGQNALVSILVGLTLAASFVLGPVLGGAFSRVDWRIIFFINVPVGVVLSVGLILFWPHGYGRSRHHWRELWRIDYLGNFLMIAACVLLVFSLQQAGSLTIQWNSATFIILFTLSAVAWIGFWCWQLAIKLFIPAMEPLFPIRLLANRVYIAALVTILLSGFSYVVLVITLPERFQIVNADSPIMAGVHILPLLGATAVGSIIGGAVSKKRNNTSYTLIVASSLQLTAVGLLTTFKAWGTSVKPEYGFQAIFGLGVGLSFSSATVLTKIQVSRDDHAVAQAAIAQVRVLGGAIGLAMCTIVFNHQIQELARWLRPEDLNKLHHAPLAALELPYNEVRMVKTSYAVAFAAELWIMLYVACGGFLASLFTFERAPIPLDSGEHGATPGGLPFSSDGRARKHPPSRGGSDTELDDFGSDRSAPGPSLPAAHPGVAL
ncbi:Multidrug resistance protein 3 [Pleurostoma richardsiae]|uniref:Multidrug resistance protein 3 n=1 Tax=Pleurostoma richardsiae TaxID=41990 RepID=A0AA38S2S3_9PEZI|nr:Multidrug resistance protein 3 [Pleurostoma richardsiae]